jgi:hypothetical protein
MYKIPTLKETTAIMVINLIKTYSYHVNPNIANLKQNNSLFVIESMILNLKTCNIHDISSFL